MIVPQITTERIHVMHLTDTLDRGGRERIAVDLVNHLPSVRYETTLCTTRREGPLAADVAEHVGRLCLHRARTLQWDAIRQLSRYIRDQQVDLLHAHGSALVIANLAVPFRTSAKIIWHDHFGTNDQRQRSVRLFRLLTRRVAGVIAVSDTLAEWSRRRLGFARDRVWQLPNCVNVAEEVSPATDLPGTPGHRVVCVANLRPAKDHLTLLRAFAVVLQSAPAAHLLLVGAAPDPAYRAAVLAEMERLGLSAQVTLLGPRGDVPAILRACDVGVLSSKSEGLPVSLLEYGAAGLAVAATDVGQCRQVLADGACGRLVAPQSPEALGNALTELLAQRGTRQQLGARFRQRVAQDHGTAAVVEQLTEIYAQVLGHH